MRSILPAAMLLLLAFTAAARTETISIAATKRTVGQTSGNEQAMPRGTSRSIEERVVYRFVLQRASAQDFGALTVEWIVCVERMEGRVTPVATGRRIVEIPPAESVTIETDPILLLGREWIDGPNPGTVEDVLAGYGIRVLDPAGAVVAEKYEPATMKTTVDWTLMDPPTTARNRSSLRGTKQPANAVTPP